MIISGKEISARAAVGNFDDSIDCLRSIPHAISGFFSHRYADFRMFCSAFSTMVNGVASHEIECRINAVCQFRIQLANEQASAGTAGREFFNFEPHVKNLFFYVDEAHVRRLSTEAHSIAIREIREEIIRECDQVISYQRTLLKAKAFYSTFIGYVFAPDSTIVSEKITVPNSTALSRTNLSATTSNTMTTNSSGTTIPISTTLNGISHGGASTSGTTIGTSFLHTLSYLQGDIPQVVLTQRSTETLNQHGARIAQYIHDHMIPQTIKDKAAEIARLSDLIDIVIPELYRDRVMLEVMTIPVFDASHPAIQNALRAANIHGGTTELNDRDLRHPIEKSSMERLIANSRPWAYSRCPICRHPENGGIRRENLRIDLALQDEILEWLRNAVANGRTTSSTSSS